MGAITLYPYILFRPKKDEIPESLFKHEMIHIRQIRQLSAVSFYLSYILYYFAGLIRYMDHDVAYYRIPYETEAFNNQDMPLDEYERQELEV